MRGKIFLLLLGFIFAFCLSILIDRITGRILNRSGYFYANAPRINEITSTSEFSITETISSQGLRDKEISVPKPKDTIRILAVGDSFTYGYGVNLEKSWIKLLEKQLNNTGKRVEIINAGKPGGGLTEDRWICKAYKDRFDADMILVGFYQDDMMQLGSRFQKFEEDPFYEFVQKTWPTLSRIRERVIGQPRFNTVKSGETVETAKLTKEMVSQMLQQNPGLLAKVDPVFRTSFVEGKMNPALVTAGIERPDALTYILNPELLRYTINSVSSSLLRFNNLCAEGLPVLVVYFPSSELVSEKYFVNRKKLGFTVSPDLLKINMDRYLFPLVSKYKFSYLSLLSEFRKDGCPDCYYMTDGHLTEKGNKRVADFLYPKITSFLLDRMVQ